MMDEEIKKSLVDIVEDLTGKYLDETELTSPWVYRFLNEIKQQIANAKKETWDSIEQTYLEKMKQCRQETAKEILDVFTTEFKGVLLVERVIEELRKKYIGTSSNSDEVDDKSQNEKGD